MATPPAIAKYVASFMFLFSWAAAYIGLSS
jgi:hypothetical protein